METGEWKVKLEIFEVLTNKMYIADFLRLAFWKKITSDQEPKEQEVQGGNQNHILSSEHRAQIRHPLSHFLKLYVPANNTIPESLTGTLRRTSPEERG